MNKAHWRVAGWLAASLLLAHQILEAHSTLAAGCLPLGWFPANVGLKDHHIFQHAGDYYLVSIHLTPEHYEDRFAYARSADLCHWQDLSPVLAERVPGTADEFRVWSPFVYEENSVYYMYYTGVSANFTQSIMLATSTNPADPASWQAQGVVFQPDHPGMVWQTGQWADCRDPAVVKVGGTYYLYYTARDASGGIIGIATAASISGPWRDWCPVLTLTAPQAMAESPALAVYDGLYYLFYNDTSQRGERYRIGASPAGPWAEADAFAPGWAHEVWRGPKGDDYTSFLTTYAVSISKLSWDTLYSPARPVVGEIHRSWLPLMSR